jgi:hypothetical protein
MRTLKKRNKKVLGINLIPGKYYDLIFPNRDKYKVFRFEFDKLVIDGNIYHIYHRNKWVVDGDYYDIKYCNGSEVLTSLSVLNSNTLICDRELIRIVRLWKVIRL